MPVTVKPLWIKPLCIMLAVVALATLLFSGVGQGLWHSLVADIIALQRTLHRGLASAMMALSRREGIGDWLDLMLLSLGYGVFHALGPGHGKAVVATYLLTHRAALTRGLVMTASAALLQGVVAIAMVTVLVLGLGWLTRDAMAGTVWIEKASFVAVTALGLWLVYRAGRGLQRLRSESASAPAAGPLQPGALRLTPTQPAGASVMTPLHHAGSNACHCCSGAHHIDPMTSGRHWREMLAAIVSIGLRPCSGAVMVLGVAAMLGFWWAGVLSVLSMSIGTALSTSLLATLTVLARVRMAHLFQRTGTRRPLGIGYTLALLGGVLITLLGIALLINAPDAALSPLMRGPLG
ncbi:ABC-type nickel/cobalt efflux system, permease component RcnA [Kushneria avicenniae]|uniref:Nickel/cobalt efflux system n=1 Tax=Kushneria avicenniae TaxID=402385 RepID=A0A1I1IAR8_9GAMM|nr:nickel/cobalt transporter [Kushneria avicenniae]SFC31358.1 ABC-type nickel/cobalt efflux system, permease component RcnA [Kushneria avicenniae]